jgi:hypothetical protein
MTPTEQIKESILTLQAQLLEANPQLHSLAKIIHTALRKDPALVTTLSDDEVGIVVSGLMNITQTTIASAIVKGAGKSKGGKQITMEDL